MLADASSATPRAGGSPGKGAERGRQADDPSSTGPGAAGSAGPVLPAAAGVGPAHIIKIHSSKSRDRNNKENKNKDLALLFRLSLLLVLVLVLLEALRSFWRCRHCWRKTKAMKISIVIILIKAMKISIVITSRFIHGAHLDGRQDINPDVRSEAVRGVWAPGGATPEPPASPGTSEEECDGDDSSWSSS